MVNKSKENLNLIVIGHVDAGKSTLMGHFLFKLGLVSERQLQKYENESKLHGKNTFHFAWTMDENTEERKRGVTMDIAYKYLEIEKFYLTIMDSPGHRDYVPNMIIGTSQADCALLIIDSQKDSFESGFFANGQTREHATIALALGVKQIIVVINKMETSNWSFERYDYIKTQLEIFLLELGFSKECIRFIPVSGLLGINLIDINNDDLKSNKWWAKESLLSMINSFNKPERFYNFPVRFNITESGIGTINNLNGFQLMGKLESGIISDSEDYCICPINIKVSIRSMRSQNDKKNLIYAGENAEILLKNINESESLQIK